MHEDRRAFLESLLATATPSGYETAGQQVWIEYVSQFADEVHTDEYGNAVAVLEGDADATVALAGHGDEIGFIVRDVTEDGFVRIDRIGGADRTVSKGQRVTIQSSDGPVPGVIGQTAIHLRNPDEDTVEDVAEQLVEIGAEDEEEALDLVDRGDPVTIDQHVLELANGRLSARGLDNRVGIWMAAEGLRRAAQRGVDATVCAVSTVQEELGLQGAKMVGFDLAPDAVLAIDVTHATDTPESPSKVSTGVELGAGPALARGSANHPVIVEGLRDTADAVDLDLQLMAAGSRTGTDADAFYTARGGIPSVRVGVPNRFMHTPVEVIDPEDLAATAELVGAFAAAATEYVPVSLELG